MMEPISVLIVDDHPLFRRGLRAVIDSQPNMKVVAEAADGREAIEAAKKFHPNVVLMDLSMPEVNGVEATYQLSREVTETNILILTISDKDEDLFSAIKAGAKGYLLKGADPEELVRAIIQVAEGGVIISPVMAPKLLSEIGTEAKLPEETVTVLSPRETEIVQLVAEGLRDKEIAEKLFISLNTAKTHLKNILVKLHVKSRIQIAVQEARKQITAKDNPE